MYTRMVIVSSAWPIHNMAVFKSTPLSYSIVQKECLRSCALMLTVSHGLRGMRGCPFCVTASAYRYDSHARDHADSDIIFPDAD